MATPMEYDTLRESFYDGLSIFVRLAAYKKVSSSVFKEDEDEMFDIWEKEVKSKEIAEIDYSSTINKLKELKSKWNSFEDALDDEVEE